MLLQIWILFCTVLVALGWLFSCFGELVLPAYLAVFAALAIVGFWFRSRLLKPFSKGRRLSRRLASSRLLLPGIFALSALLLLLKGLLTPPFHDDGLCYRIPRALHWIMEHRWHWLNAEDIRLDVCGANAEWLSVPILLIFRDDRLVFLPNWISHLFLPGLIFFVWRRLGVPSKTAWLCMWLLPSGFCFALQAVNTSNDSLGAFFVLAAFYFALKGKDTGNWYDLAFSILCMALATGVKLNLLAFGLAWIAAILWGWRTLWCRPLSTIGILLLSVLVSFAPTAFFNWSHGRGWTGLGSDQLPPPAINYLCNVFHIVVQNLMPPLLAGQEAGAVDIPGIENSGMGILIQHYFLHNSVYYSQIPVEQAGLGFVVVIVLVVLFLVTKAAPHIWSDYLRRLFSRRSIIFGGLSVAFFHYLFFVNSDQPARLISAYYLLLLPAFFVERNPLRHIPWRIYKVTVGVAMLSGLYLALFFTENPLGDFFPLFRARYDWDEIDIQKAREVIPSQEKAVGVIRFYNQREEWLWRPYESRMVFELPLKPDPARVQNLGIQYIVVSKEMLVLNHLTIESWLAKQSSSLVGSVLAGQDNTWYFVKMEK